jgi:hypothetical protein
MSESVVLQTWHQIVRNKDRHLLEQLLDDDVVFFSPVVHGVQKGKAITFQYLAAALQVFGRPGFKYVRQMQDGRQALLEFELEVDGLHINGIDLFTWNEQNKIVEFKVMIRPLRAIQAIHAAMGAQLGQGNAAPTKLA